MGLRDLGCKDVGLGNAGTWGCGTQGHRDVGNGGARLRDMAWGLYKQTTHIDFCSEFVKNNLWWLSER